MKAHFGLLIAALLVPSLFAYADEDGPIKVRLTVESQNEPTKAVGLLMSTEGTEQVTETKIAKLGDKLYEVTFSVERDRLKQDSVASALTTTPGGDVAFANVTPVLLTDPRLSLGTIPDCPADDGSQFQASAQVGPLRSLVEIRAARAELARIKIARALSSDLLTRLERIEQTFGLQRTSPLSADLPPPELVDRLARVVASAKSLSAFKKDAGKSKKSSE